MTRFDEDEGDDDHHARRFEDMDKGRADDDSYDDQQLESGGGSAASAGRATTRARSAASAGGATTRARRSAAAASASSSSGAGTSQRVFKCYLEPWEERAVFNESDANAKAVLAKYGGMRFIDEDVENMPLYVIFSGNVEFSRDVDPPQYGVFAETEEGDDDDPFYLINDELMGMIALTQQDEDVVKEERTRDEGMDGSD